VQVYCGILRSELQNALVSAKGPEVEVCEAIRLLADQTRFDIVCYLRDRDAYGQELAAKFGLSRNTIHHHMTKLLAAHLVKCTVDGNRVYYRADEKGISRLLERQRELLLPK
jgi:DNA-binding transcriptional ArsR family regulator